MIINIRGTSGSGKTTLVRRLVDGRSRHDVVRVTQLGKTRTVGHVVQLPTGRELFLLGRYPDDRASGGCDVLDSDSRRPDTMCDLIREHYAAGRHVIYEGLTASSWSPVKRVKPLAAACGGELVVVVLTTTEAECRAALEQRRAAEGARTSSQDHERIARKVASKYGEVRRSVGRLRWAGICVEELDRDAALAFCREEVMK